MEVNGYCASLEKQVRVLTARVRELEEALRTVRDGEYDTPPLPSPTAPAKCPACNDTRRVRNGNNDDHDDCPTCKPASEAFALRPSVAEFAQRMETVLRRHDAKKGGQANWRKDHVDELIERLVEEVDELQEATKIITNPDKMAAEAIDVANFALMIVDKCDPLPVDPSPASEAKPVCRECWGTRRALGDADGAAVYYPCPACSPTEGGPR